MIELRRVTQIAWRKFINSEEGKEGLAILYERIPNIGKGSSEEIIFQAGNVQGQKDVLLAISDLLGEVEKKESDPSND